MSVTQSLIANLIANPSNLKGTLMDALVKSTSLDHGYPVSSVAVEIGLGDDIVSVTRGMIRDIVKERIMAVDWDNPEDPIGYHYSLYMSFLTGGDMLGGMQFYFTEPRDKVTGEYTKRLMCVYTFLPKSGVCVENEINTIVSRLQRSLKKKKPVQ